MTTKQAIDRYFDFLERGEEWQSCLAEDMTFTSFTTPIKQIRGRDSFLQNTERFYRSIQAVQVRDLLVEGDRACAFTHYELRGPNGAFASDVAESFIVKDGKIASFSIYFDSAPFPK